MDQSIVFDGAFRIGCGQVPFRDFHAPIGLLLFYIQYLFNCLGGVNFGSYLLHSCMANALGALLAWGIISRFFPNDRYTGWIAALLTGVWLYPIFGTPWFEQEGFLLILAALWALLMACGKNSAPGLSMAGGLSILPFFCKQNVGIFILPLFYLLLLFLPGDGEDSSIRRKRIIWFMAGQAAGLGIVLSGIALFMDWKTFVHDYFTIPLALGKSRVVEGGSGILSLLRPLLGLNCCSYEAHDIILWLRLPMTLMTWLSLFLLVRAVRGRESSGQMAIPVAITALYLLVFQYLFIHSTANQAYNGMAFSGIVIALLAGLTRAENEGNNGKTVMAIPVVTFVFAALFIFCGCHAALDRVIHEPLRFSEREFREQTIHSRLKPLQWCHPTLMPHMNEIGHDDVRDMVKFLRYKNRSFFVFTDFTMLYGIVGKVSSFPLVWFHEGLTYARSERDRVDQMMVDYLESREIGILVMEKINWNAYYADFIKKFPRFNEYVNREYTFVTYFGIYILLERRP